MARRLDHAASCSAWLRVLEVERAEDRDEGREEARERREVRDLRAGGEGRQLETYSAQLRRRSRRSGRSSDGDAEEEGTDVRARATAASTLAVSARPASEESQVSSAPCAGRQDKTETTHLVPHEPDKAV